MVRDSVLEAVFLGEERSDVQPDISLDEFFPPGFMRAYTEFQSFEEFRARFSSEFEDRTDLETISKERLDRYVARVTAFDSWREMRNRAAEREVRERFLI